MTHEWHAETVRRGFDELFSHIRSGAVERERERDLPLGIVRELAGRGLGRLRLPRSDGGEGIALPALFAIIEDLAYADPNIAHVFRNHLNFVEQVLLTFRPDRRGPFVRRIAAGEIFAASLENYSGASGSNQSPPSLSPAADGSLRLNVTQHYSTGNLYADVLSVPVEVGGRRLTAFIPTNAPGVAIPDDWRGFGQRLTASGSTVFDDVEVTEDVLVDHAELLTDDRPEYTAIFPQLYLLHLISGIVHSALDEAVDVIGSRTRNYYHGLTDRPADDPQVQSVVGHVSAVALANSYLLKGVVADLDAAFTRSPATGLVDAEAVRRAAYGTAKAKSVVQVQSLAAVTELFDATSGTSLSDELGLDRHWRNIRTIANHNPRTYKERLIGRAELTGEPIPAGKAFF